MSATFTASDLPTYYARLAKQSTMQPLFRGRGSIFQESVVIPLSWDDARIFHILNENSTKILGKDRAWSICDFGCGNRPLFDSNGQNMDKGVIVSREENPQRCSLDELERSYEKILTLMRSGWERADPQNHPYMHVKKDTKKFSLFVKQQTLLTEEDSLIRFIASRLLINDKDFICQNEWWDQAGAHICSGKLYVWVNNRTFQTVVEKTGLRLPS